MKPITFESKPWSNEWLRSGIRHLRRNVDYDAFCSEEEIAKIGAKESIVPKKTDAPVLAASPVLKEALESILLCRNWYEGRPELALENAEALAKAALAMIEGGEVTPGYGG